MCVAGNAGQTPDSSSSSIPPAVCKVVVEEDGVVDDNIDGGPQIRSIRTWLFEVRQACYSLLGLATKVVPNMYQLPTLPEMLFSSIFSHLHTTALWHIRLLLRTVPATHSLTRSLTHSLVRDDGSISAGLFATELVLNCPTERLEPVFGRLLPVLLEQVFHILHSNWRDMVLRDQAYASERTAAAHLSPTIRLTT